MESFENYKSNIVKNNDKKLSFNDYLFKLMHLKKLEPCDIYKSANISRQTFSKIINNEVKPSLNTSIKLAIGLKCTNKECKLLLKKLDYTLSSYNDFNLIIRYSLDKQIYDINKINMMLFEKTGKCLEDKY